MIIIPGCLKDSSNRPRRPEVSYACASGAARFLLLGLQPNISPPLVPPFCFLILSLPPPKSSISPLHPSFPVYFHFLLAPYPLSHPLPFLPLLPFFHPF